MAASAPKPPPTCTWKPSTVSSPSGDRHPAAEQPDVADVVLRARVRAAGQVDVDRRVEADPRLHPLGDRQRRVLGVGGRELAAGVAGAGDQAGADAATPSRSGRWPAGAPRPRPRARRRRRRSAGSARRSGGYRRRPARRAMRGQARASAPPSCARPGSATPTQTRPACFCACTPMCACRCCRLGSPPDRSATRLSGLPSLASTAARNFSKPQSSSTYLSRAFLRSVRSP